MINPDEGIDLGVAEKPQHSLRVLARFTSLGELVRITDELAGQNVALRAELAAQAETIRTLEGRIRAIEALWSSSDAGRLAHERMQIAQAQAQLRELEQRVHDIDGRVGALADELDERGAP